MREIYIPSGETYVFEQEGLIKGFISLSNDTLAAIFVSPDSQGKVIGTQLMRKAKDIRDNLNLTVYKNNLKSIEFYKKSGFKIEQEQIDKHTGHQKYWSSILYSIEMKCDALTGCTGFGVKAALPCGPERCA